MKPDDKIEIIRNPYIQPDKIVLILSIVLGSFALGLVPILPEIMSSATGNFLKQQLDRHNNLVITSD